MTAAAGLALAALLGVPMNAAASTVKKVASATGDFAIVSATARCPKGELATGGGFATTPPTNSSSLQVYESRKLDQTRWRVTGQISDHSGSFKALTLEAFAYCSKTSPFTVERSKTGAAPFSLTSWHNDPTDWYIDATCPKGKTAMAGGFLGAPPYSGSPTGDPRSTVHKSLLTDDETGHRAGILTSILGDSLTSYAYCAKQEIFREDGHTLSQEIEGSQRIAFSGECETKARKKKKKNNKTKIIPAKTLTAGGFDEPNASLSGNPRRYTPVASFKVGKQWWVIGIYHGNPTSPTGGIYLVSEAYCS